MKNIAETPQTEAEIQKLKSRIAELEALVKFYEEQVRLAKHKQFGTSSEKTEYGEQFGLFDEVENEADKKVTEPQIETITYTRKKREGKREEDLSNLPVEIIEYALPDNEQTCPECKESLHVMSKEVRRELKIIPAQVKVIEHVKLVYACRSCEKNNNHVPVITACAPEPVIKGSLASPSAVAHIMVQKYVNAVPLYRQEQNFLREGIALSRQTMANWMIRCAHDWLALIYEHMKCELLKQSVLHADETVVQVLREPDKKASSNSYMWLYRTSGCASHPIALYEYQPTRSSAHPKKFLLGFDGYLHTDGYAGYHCIADITVIGCWAHARRKFDEALKSMPEDSRKGSLSEIGLDFCNHLFALEREFQSLTAEKRYEKRLEKSKPIAEAFFEWAKSTNALPKSALGKAINYALEQRTYLENVFLDGRLELSNNRAERSIKPFVIGRKNWLFCSTQKGAMASSVIYSIIETSKENGLIPFAYLNFLLEALPNATTAQLNSLLPWSASLPSVCRVSKS